MYLFGFDVNVLELLFFFNIAMLALLILVLMETRQLKKLIDEMQKIDDDMGRKHS
ncbi:Uncharacterised protein [Candidatus Norongarragalina meridionalis]|nr:Uncharacterised protein [Candidatus Norongarragalina meridionalis]